MINTAKARLYSIKINGGQFTSYSTRNISRHSTAVGIVAKFNAEPTQAHLTAVNRIFRYLKGTLHVTLQYKSTGDKSLGYFDQTGQGTRMIDIPQWVTSS